jgi:hypothetical protein
MDQNGYYTRCWSWMKMDGRGLFVDENWPAGDNMVTNPYRSVGQIHLRDKMDVLLHNLSVCEYKTFSKRKKYMLSMGLEPMQFVSEEYCHHVLTHLATYKCGK